jgi:hypothetical protein
MNLKDLKNCVDQAFEKSVDGEVDVSVYIVGEGTGDRVFRIKEIGQFGFIRDVNIGIEEF